MKKKQETYYLLPAVCRLVLLIVAAGFCAVDDARAVVLSIGNQRQLFIDDWIVESSSHIQRQPGTVVKNPINPIFVRDKAWDAGRCDIYGSGVYDPGNGRLQVFYSAVSMPNGHDDRLAYAESQDMGASWMKPDMDLVPFGAYQQTNLLLNAASEYFAGPSIFRDDHETDPAKRYKMFTSDYYSGVTAHSTRIDGVLYANHALTPPGTGKAGLYIAYSPDGIHWTRPSEPCSNIVSDTTQSAFWDARLGKYVAYIRTRPGASQLRGAARMTSPDFQTWSTPQIVFPAQSGTRQIYSMGVTPYQGIYIGTPWIFNAAVTADEPTVPVIWPELAVSREGISWSQPFAGRQFIPTGAAGSADSAQIRMSSSIIEMDDRVVLIYGQTNRGHIADMRVDVGMATMRLDGFTAMEAADQAGGIYTKPFLLEGKRLFINAVTDGAKDGWIRVGVFDENGAAIPGFSNQLCVPIEGDGLYLPVQWDQGASLAELRGRPVRLLFQLQNASLFSFVVDESKPGDANRDGVVDAADASILAANWMGSGKTWTEGDFNEDGVVDTADATLMATNWQQAGPADSAVPEPAAAVLFVSLTIGLLAWQSAD